MMKWLFWCKPSSDRVCSNTLSWQCSRTELPNVPRTLHSFEPGGFVAREPASRVSCAYAKAHIPVKTNEIAANLSIAAHIYVRYRYCCCCCCRRLRIGWLVDFLSSDARASCRPRIRAASGCSRPRGVERERGRRRSSCRRSRRHPEEGTRRGCRQAQARQRDKPQA